MSKKKKKNGLFKAVALGTTALAATYGGTAFYMFQQAFDLDKSKFHQSNKVKILSINDEKSKWYKQIGREDIFIDSFDQLSLHATKIEAPNSNHRWILFSSDIDAYDEQRIDYLFEAYQRGFNIIMIDQRGCGMSEGRYTSLGYVEHRDVLSWIEYLIGLDTEAKIILYGVAVGASAVLHALGQYIPKQVVCAISDNAISDVKELLLYHIRKNINIDANLLMPGIEFFIYQKLHCTFEDMNTIEKVKKCDTPLLLLHGSADEVVPVSNLFDNYYNCISEKEMVSAKDAGFKEMVLEDKYFNEVFRFIAKYI